MKEVVLVSDSHRLRNFWETLKNKYPEADYFFHCGDSELSKEEMAGWATVEGNCDYYFEFPAQLKIEIGRHSFLLVHGDRAGYPYDRTLPALAKKYGCDVVCYGHTHVPMDQMSDGIRLINPGSLRYNRDGSEPGYMVLSVYDERIETKWLPYQP